MPPCPRHRTRRRGRCSGHLAVVGARHLAGVRAQAPPRRGFQAVPGPAVHRQGPRLGLYLNPPEAAVVLCVDEKTQIQALDRTAPGTPQRRTHDCRHGTTNLFAALDTASGNVITSMTARHRSEEFRKFLNLTSPPTSTCTLDNVSTHKAVKRGSSRLQAPLHPHLQLLDEPPSAGSQSCRARRGTHTSVKDLKDSINTWVENWNGPQTLHMAQNRRPDTRQPRLIYPPNSPDRTLGVC